MGSGEQLVGISLVLRGVCAGSGDQHFSRGLRRLS